MSSAPGIEGLADSIVARDLVAGRPGKRAAGFVEPSAASGRTPVAGRLPVLVGTLAVVAATLGALLVGLLTGGDTATTATMPPSAKVAVTPESPDAVTVPANPAFSGPVRTSTSFVCSGQAASVVTNTAQLTLGQGRFLLDPAGLPPFTGTVSGNVVSATATTGSLTGILAAGATETFSWVATASTFVPCAGTFPVTVVLPQALNLQPTVAQGPPLAGVVDPGTVIAAPAPRRPASGVNWGLVAGGEAGALTGLIVILVLSPGLQDEDDPVAKPLRRTPR